jgi:ketosteroid isomerase-like protein
MSRENVELVRSWQQAWNRGDIDQMLSLLDPEVEWRTSGAFLGLDPVYTGHDGFRRFLREFVEPWESFQIKTEETRDCGERVLALGSFEAQGRDGLEVRRPTAGVWTFRGGRAVVVQVYPDQAQALEAVGAGGVAMSREEMIEALQRAHDAFNRGLEEFIACYTEDIELVPDRTWPEQGPFCGKDAARRWWEGIVSQYDERFIQSQDVMPLDDRRALVETRWQVRGRTSQMADAFVVWTVHTLRGGLICRSQFFFDRSEALEAAGLGESGS